MTQPNEIQTRELLAAAHDGYCRPGASDTPKPWWQRDHTMGNWPRLTDEGWDARVRAGGKPRDEAHAAAMASAS